MYTLSKKKRRKKFYINGEELNENDYTFNEYYKNSKSIIEVIHSFACIAAE